MNIKPPILSAHVSICGQCWTQASWGPSEEYQALLSSQRYTIVDGRAWLHREATTEEGLVYTVCGQVRRENEAFLSLLEFPLVTARVATPVETESAIEAGQAGLDRWSQILSEVLTEGLENIAMAIRDQGRPL